MENKKTRSISQRTVLTLDIIESHSSSGQTHVTVVIERPGTQGHFRKDWMSPTATLSHHQGVDLATWVTRSVQNALSAFGTVRPDPEA